MTQNVDSVTINQIVTEWITSQNPIPFTAFSVFQELQKRGTLSGYNDVKKLIKHSVSAFVKNGTYKVSKITTVTGDALLYHAPTYDPNTFPAVKTAVTTGAAPTTPVVTTNNVTAVSTRTDDDPDIDI